MKLATIIVTRSKAVHVKTLHTVLRLNLHCIQRRDTQNEVVYVNDDPYDKSSSIQKYMKSADRILFIDFGVSLDEGSIGQVLADHNGIGCVVFPGVTEGIDWGMFKAKVKDGSTEPVEQMGLHFDTKVGKKVGDDLYQVDKTGALSWVMMLSLIHI